MDSRYNLQVNLAQYADDAYYYELFINQQIKTL